MWQIFNDKRIKNFENAIKEHEDQLFGFTLFMKGIKALYGHDKAIMEINERAYKNIVERGGKALSQSKQLLDKVSSGTENIMELQKFHFPPICGPGLDEMTKRVKLLVNAYEKLFPERPRKIPLSTEDYEKIKKEAMDKL